MPRWHKRPDNRERRPSNVPSLRDYIGLIGTVTLRIAPDKPGEGEVRLKHPLGIEIRPQAFSVDPEETIEPDTQVLVIDVKADSNAVLVTPWLYS